MTKILLVRHGHVEGISPERFRGRADLSLTAEGVRQAEATALRIRRTWKVSRLYSSPLSRCLATATPIGKLFGLTAIAMEGLSDIDYGDWQGLTPDEVRARWTDQLMLWYERPDWAVIPKGETLQELLCRATGVLREMIRQHPDETVAVVGHDSVNRVLLLHVLDLPLSRYWRIQQHPCAINEIDFVAGCFTVISLNQRDHIL
jgi:broad specificity phosphatase PhoE